MMLDKLFNFNNISSVIDDIFNEDDWFSRFPFDFSVECGDVFGNTGVPTDIFLRQNRDFVIKAAVAGYDKKEISISFDGNYLLISGKRVNKDWKQETEGVRYLHKGIKKSNFNARLCVPRLKYEQELTTAEIADGILTIVVPSKEVSKTKNKEKFNININ